jgi:Protein of unknown function (DUF3137)
VSFHSQSDFPVQFIFFAVVIVIVIFGAIYSAIAARKRREGLFELAQRLNLNFDAGQDFGIPGRFGFLKQLDQGDNRYATNVLSGIYQQNEILAFDYHYETVVQDKNGSHKEAHWFSFFILTMPADFPDLTIRRENFFTKVAEVFGYQDIRFESAEFSKTFNVRSPDKKFAYDVCNAKMMEYLLANRDLNLEFENEVMALAFNTRIAAGQFEVNLQRLVEVRSRLPDYLFTQNT